MKVTMLEAREAALDGVRFVSLEKGETYDAPEFLGESYVARGIAKKASADAELALAEPVPDPEAALPESEESHAEDAAGEEAAEAEAEAEEPKPARKARSSRARG